MTTTRTHLAAQYRTATTSNTSLEGSLQSLRFSTALVTTHGICDIILTPCCVMCLCTWQFDAASVIPWGRRVSCRSGAHNTDNYNHYPSQSWLASVTMTKLSPTETQFTFFYKQWKYNSHHRQSWINHFYYYITYPSLHYLHEESVHHVLKNLTEGKVLKPLHCIKVAHMNAYLLYF